MVEFSIVTMMICMHVTNYSYSICIERLNAFNRLLRHSPLHTSYDIVFPRLRANITFSLGYSVLTYMWIVDGIWNGLYFREWRGKATCFGIVPPSLYRTLYLQFSFRLTIWCRWLSVQRKAFFFSVFYNFESNSINVANHFEFKERRKNSVKRRKKSFSRWIQLQRELLKRFGTVVLSKKCCINKESSNSCSGCHQLNFVHFLRSVSKECTSIFCVFRYTPTGQRTSENTGIHSTESVKKFIILIFPVKWINGVSRNRKCKCVCKCPHRMSCALCM